MTESSFSNKLLPFLWQCANKPRYLLCFGGILLCSLIVSFSEIGFSLVIRDFVNLMSQDPLTFGDFSGVIMFAAVLLVASFIGAVIRETLWKVGRNPFEIRTKEKLFEHVQKHSHAFFIGHSAGDIAHKVYWVSWTLVLILDVLTFQFLPIAGVLLFAVIFLAILNPLLGLATFIWIVVYVLLCAKLGKINARLSSVRMKRKSNVAAVIVDNIVNQQVVRLFGTRETEAQRLQAYTFREEKAQGRQFLFQRKYAAINEGMRAGYLLFVLCWAVQLHLAAQISAGDFVLILSVLMLIFSRSGNLNGALRNLFDNIGVVREGISLICRPPEYAATGSEPDLQVGRGKVCLKNISFAYTEKNIVLDRLDCTIPARQKIGLVGASGAGKSTLVSLLLRFFEPDEGEIHIDGQPISRFSKESLTAHIAVIPQDTSLFHRSLMDNIRYGQPHATDDEVIEAAKKARAHEFISGLPQKYRTLVGERGVKLSGGQRQRIAIARAILKDAPILILDEATSALDSESEKLIQESLKELMEGKTVIAIAHRLSTIAHLDRLIVMDKGQIVEDGTHEDLLKHGGLYARLWHMQSGGFLGE